MTNKLNKSDTIKNILTTSALVALLATTSVYATGPNNEDGATSPESGGYGTPPTSPVLGNSRSPSLVLDGSQAGDSVRPKFTHDLLQKTDSINLSHILTVNLAKNAEDLLIESPIHFQEHGKLKLNCSNSAKTVSIVFANEITSIEGVKPKIAVIVPEGKIVTILRDPNGPIGTKKKPVQIFAEGGGEVDTTRLPEGTFNVIYHPNSPTLSGIGSTESLASDVRRDKKVLLALTTGEQGLLQPIADKITALQKTVIYSTKELEELTNNKERAHQEVNNLVREQNELIEKNKLALQEQQNNRAEAEKAKQELDTLYKRVAIEGNRLNQLVAEKKAELQTVEQNLRFLEQQYSDTRQDHVDHAELQKTIESSQHLIQNLEQKMTKLETHQHNLAQQQSAPPAAPAQNGKEDKNNTNTNTNSNQLFKQSYAQLRNKLQENQELLKDIETVHAQNAVEISPNSKILDICSEIYKDAEEEGEKLTNGLAVLKPQGANPDFNTSPTPTTPHNFSTASTVSAEEDVAQDANMSPLFSDDEHGGLQARSGSISSNSESNDIARKGQQGHVATFLQNKKNARYSPPQHLRNLDSINSLRRQLGNIQSHINNATHLNTEQFQQFIATQENLTAELARIKEKQSQLIDNRNTLKPTTDITEPDNPEVAERQISSGFESIIKQDQGLAQELSKLQEQTTALGVHVTTQEQQRQAPTVPGDNNSEVTRAGAGNLGRLQTLEQAHAAPNTQAGGMNSQETEQKLTPIEQELTQGQQNLDTPGQQSNESVDSNLIDDLLTKNGSLAGKNGSLVAKNDSLVAKNDELQSALSAQEELNELLKQAAQTLRQQELAMQEKARRAENARLEAEARDEYAKRTRIAQATAALEAHGSPAIKKAIEVLMNPANTTGNSDTAQYSYGLLSMYQNNPQTALKSLERDVSSHNLTQVLGNFQNAGVNAIQTRIGVSQMPAAAGDQPAEARYGVWGSPFYALASQKHTKDQNGYNTRSIGGTVGFDTKANETMTLGVAATYAQTNVKHKDYLIGDKDKINSYLLSIYGTQVIKDDYFVTGIANLSTHKVKSDFIGTRQGLKGIIEEKKQASYDIMSFGAELVAGYNYKARENVTITPTIGVSYNQFGGYSFTEKGDQVALKKQFTTKQSHAIDAIAGIKIASTHEFNDIMFTPEIHAKARYSFINKAPQTSFKLEGMVGEIEQNVAKASKISGSVGTSLTAHSGMFDYGLGYDLTIAKKYLGHQGSVKVRLNF